MNKPLIAVLVVASVFFALTGISYLASSANPPVIAATTQAKPVPMTAEQIRSVQAANQQAAQQSAAAEARVQQCDAALRKGARADLFRRIEVRGDFATVIVGRNFFLLPYEEKARLAELMSCNITGGDASRCANLTLLDPMNHKRIGRFIGCSLEMM